MGKEGIKGVSKLEDTCDYQREKKKDGAGAVEKLDNLTPRNSLKLLINK